MFPPLTGKDSGQMDWSVATLNISNINEHILFFYVVIIVNDQKLETPKF